jgi:two-component system cit operon sensor histidine kinase CitA
MQKIAAHSDASFIVIGDNKGSICFIPSLPTEWAQRWSAETTRYCRVKAPPPSAGGLGISLRSKAPIFNDAGQVVGIVSVGYLTSYLDTITVSKVVNILIAAVLLLCPVYLLVVFTRSIRSRSSPWSRAKSACWCASKRR